MTGNDHDDEVVVATARDGVARATLTPSSDQRRKIVLIKPHVVIPVIFIPGIMGTNLRNRTTGEQAWRPPNLEASIAGLKEVAGSFGSSLFRGPADRQKLLTANDVEVDYSGPIDTANSGLSEDTARTRGWGALMRSSYHPGMAQLQHELNNIARSGKLMPWWGTWGITQPGDFGAEAPAEALSSPELFRAAHYQFDVWAGGYAWPKSNRDSALDVIRYIEDKVLAHYRFKKVPAKKVILVTHSMGGLVSRAITEIHRYDKVLGVVHGVMPATGAPTTYKVARSGYDLPESVILGRDAGEVIAVMAVAPGAMELLPTADYNNGKPWLYAQNWFTG